MRSFLAGLAIMAVLAVVTGLVLDRTRVPTTSESPASVRLTEK